MIIRYRQLSSPSYFSCLMMYSGRDRMRGKEKLIAAGWVLAHLAFSVLALLCAGFTTHLFRPLLSNIPSSQFAKSPVMIGVLLLLVAISGSVLYRRFNHTFAFFPWVIPALWCLHLLLTRDREYLWRSNDWDMASTLLMASAAYSSGAIATAVVNRWRHSRTASDNC